MGRLYGLDALRGIAALLVVIGHTEKVTHSAWPVGHYGLAVDFFFMLSGYVMARTYENRLAERTISPVGFLARRFRRLWPIAALGVVLALAYSVATGPVNGNLLLKFAAALLFLPFPGSSWIFPLNGPRWSLFTELVANFIHALLLARLSNRALGAVLALLTIAYVWIAMAFGDWQLAGRADEILPALVRTLVSYVGGILLFRHYRDRTVFPVRLPVLCAVLAFALPFSAQFPADVSGVVFTLFVCPWLIVAGASVQASSRSARFAAAAGQMSYPLYALHYPPIEFAASWLSPLALLGTVLFACLLIFALLSSGVWEAARQRVLPARARLNGTIDQPGPAL